MFRSYFYYFYHKTIWKNFRKMFLNHLPTIAFYFWQLFKAMTCIFWEENLKNEEELNLNINEMTYPTQNRSKTT
jgi:hypothetical protein